MGFSLKKEQKGFKDGVTRIHSAHGLAKEYPAQRFFRDARFLLLGGGTSEVLKTIIARDTIKNPDSWD